jgi:hypothetical protein
MAMSKERQGEIALLHLKNKVKNDGIRIGGNTLRQIHATAKELGIRPEEAVEFVETLTRELVEQTFGKK